MKIYQGAFSVLALPASIALEVSGSIPENTTSVVVALAASGLATLCIGSLFMRNVVGMLYVNEEGTTLKVAYPDFWGRRKDQEILISDIVAPSNISTFKWSPAFNITTGASTKYRLLGSFGQILDRNTFISIFGEN